ncbi:hypothetical protein Cni_G10379 [Canna indica]|uniref:Uncharacterized protein n=1 Tax=Canna indica TaxID=4628 RepID=A0AAQ3K499_9LILI|nr:hypothetical protein Cni_G10379 [Canna indica]
MDKLNWVEISNEEAKKMKKDLTMEEIKRVACSLDRGKSLEKDGYILDIVKEKLKSEMSAFMILKTLPEVKG